MGHERDGIGEKTVYVKDREEVLLTLKKGRDREGSGVWTEIDIKAPKESVVYQVHITKQQKEKNRQRLQASAMLRTERIDGYYREELAEKYPEEENFTSGSRQFLSDIWIFRKGQES